MIIQCIFTFFETRKEHKANVFDIYVRNEKTSKFSKILEKVFTYMVTQAEVDANYNMDMWVKECDKGIVSCFEAKVGHEQSISSARYLNYQPFSSQLTKATMTTNFECQIT